MGEFLKLSFRSKEGLRAYLKWFGLCLGALFLLHMTALIIGLVNDNYSDGWKNIYESTGSVAAGAVFGTVLYGLTQISLQNGTSRLSLVVGTGALALVFGALSAVLIEAVYLVTDGIFRLAGMRLDCIVMSDGRYTFASGEDLGRRAMNDLLAYDPRFIFFTMCETLLLILLCYTAVIVFLAVKRRTNLFGGAIAAAVTAYCYESLFIDYDCTTVLGEIMGSLNDSMRYIGEILHPDPMDPIGPGGTYFGAVTGFLSTGLGIFMIGYLVFAMFSLRAPAVKKRKGVV